MISDKAFIFNEHKQVDLNKGEFTWKSPSNIALVKYWGKCDPQIPKNASLSFTLNHCHTITTLEYSKKKIPANDFSFDVIFEGEKNEQFKPKIKIFFERIFKYIPFIKEFNFIIRTKNSFPHSSGIASSASGMSALALCLMSMEMKMNSKINENYFLNKASFLARLGSGSACRSIEGPLVIWGEHSEIKNSSNLFGIRYPFQIHQNFKNYQDTILLVDKGEKKISSTVGHNLMHGHPFSEQRFKQANNNISKLSVILQNGNLAEFIRLVESEALTLHAMMMTSAPCFILMKPNTLKIIERIWAFRKNTNCNICFTLDAGANVHVLFPEHEKKIVGAFILNELVTFCQKNHYICDSLGNGAMRL